MFDIDKQNIFEKKGSDLFFMKLTTFECTIYVWTKHIHDFDAETVENRANYV